MKTFADKLATRPCKADETAVWMSTLLKKSTGNHSHETTTMVERYVFDDAAIRAISELFPTAESKRKCLEICALPTLPMFVSIISDGYFIDFDSDNDPCIWTFHDAKHHGAVSFVRIKVEDLMSGSTKSLYTTELFEDDTVILRSVYDKLHLLPILLAAITQPRMSTVERVHPSKGDTTASRTMARRAMQRGKPMYSYNKVTIDLPKHSHQGGEIAGSQAFTPRRGHNVIGHWRLITRTETPYFVWIQPHTAGDPELGWITKERHIKIKGGVRHGYLLPEFAGQNGQRIEATATP